MNRRVSRAVAALAAAVLGTATMVVAAPAYAGTTIQVDHAASTECTSGTQVCQTIAKALSFANPGDTINVASGTYDETVSITMPLTLTGNGATITEPLSVQNPGGAVNISGFTFGPDAALTGALVSVTESAAGTAPDAVDIHDNTFTGPASTGVAITSTSAAPATPSATVTGNTFGGSLADAAIALSTGTSNSLDAVVSGNTGTVSSGAHTIVADGGVTLETPAQVNSIGSAGTSIVPSKTSLPLTTLEPATPFSIVTSSDLALSSPTIDVRAAFPAAVNAADFHLVYSPDGAATEVLPGGGSTLTGTLPTAALPGASPTTSYFTAAAGSSVPAGSSSLAFSLDETVHSVLINTVTAPTLPMTITANSAPVPQNISVTTPRNQPVGIALNATDPDGDPITYGFTSSHDLGDLSGTAPNLTYTPHAGATGTDTFTYTASDPYGHIGTGTIHVTVANAAPIAVAPGTVAVPADTPVQITLSGGDPNGDALLYWVDQSATAGALSPASGQTLGTNTTPQVLPAGGVTVTYTPTSTYRGTDSFVYYVSDGASTDHVTVNLAVADGAPVATALSQIPVTFETTSGDIVLSGSDPNNDPLTYTVSTPASGSLDVTAGSHPLTNNSVTVHYTPTGRFTGTDSFTFTVDDGTMTASTIVTLLVGPNTPPVAHALSQTPVVMIGSSGTPIVLNGTDADPYDNTHLAYVVTPTSQAGGTVSDTNHGSTATYTPPAKGSGIDSFQYAVSDGSVLSAWTTVTVTLDNRPTAKSISVAYGVNSGTHTIQLVATADTAKTFTVSQAGMGTVNPLNSSTGLVSYKVPTNFVGMDSFTFSIKDANGASSRPATVTINITKAAATITKVSVPGGLTSADQPTVRVSLSSRGVVNNGRVTVSTGSVQRSATVSGDGVAALKLPNLTGGSHTLSVSYGGTATTKPASGHSAPFTVSRVGSTLSVTTSPQAITTATRGATATVFIKANLAARSGTVIVRRDSPTGIVLKSGAPSNGRLTFNVPAFPSPGQYNFYISYTGNSYIAPPQTLWLPERIPAG